MKKFLSLTIVLTMLLSVFYCFPAEARVYEDYPYIYLDFEENNLDQLKANGEVGTMASKWTAGGANGTSGCISLEESGNWGNNRYALKNPLTVGRTYRASVWVKIKLDDFKGVVPRIDFILYTKSHDNHTAYKSVSLSGTPAPNEWVHCTGTFVWDGMALNEGNESKNEAITPDAPTTLALRIAAAGSTFWMQLSTNERYGSSFKLTYDMDDIVIEPESKTDEPTYDDSYIVAADFEDGSYGGLTGAKSIVNDAERGGKVAYVESPKGSFNQLMAASTPLKFNHLYKISCWVKRTDDLAVYNGEKSRVDCINLAHTRMDFTNIAPTVQYPGYGISGLEQNKWQYFEYHIKYDVKTFDGAGAQTGIRVGNSASSKAMGQTGEIGLEGVQFYVDDFLIQDLGCVQNGDFEHEQAEIFRVETAGTSKKIDSVFGWLPENATSSVSTDVRSESEDPESESTKSMSVNITSNGGRVYQGINFENGKEYTISFWAKGLDMAAGEEKPISIKLDRKVNTVHAKDVYNVPDEETLGDNWTLTNQWKQYECTFTPNYEAASTPEKNVIPRTPFMYFDVDGNKAGTKFLIDDITFVDLTTIVVPEVNPYPYIEDTMLIDDEAVSGATIRFSYEFASDIGNMEYESVVRALISDDGKNWGCIGQSVADFGEASYVVPDLAIGKKLKIEIAPMDEDYQMGDVATVAVFDEVKKSFEIQPEITKWDESTGEVAASVYIENNLSKLGNQDVVVILALYNDDNALIGTTIKSETITVGYAETIKISALSDESAANAKLYVWSGTSLADAGEKSYCEAVSYYKDAVD